MRVGIIGAGDVGETLARICAAAGHDVAIANSRGPQTLTELVARLSGVTAVTAEQAAQWAEVVIEAVPFHRTSELPSQHLAGRIVVSASNHQPERDGALPDGDLTDTEHVARRLPGARVVKAFNTIAFQHLAVAGDTDLDVADRRAIYLAGDDEDAKLVVSDLVTSLGFGPVDTGSLAAGGLAQQPGSVLYDQQLTVAEALDGPVAVARRDGGVRARS